MPNAGLLPAALLAQRIDVAGLIESRLHLAEHGVNSGTKALTVIGSMLAGGDHIDHTAVLRAGATGSLFDLTRAPSTVGTWLRAHKWSNVRQLDAVSRELLARLWASGAGPADLSGPLTMTWTPPSWRSRAATAGRRFRLHQGPRLPAARDVHAHRAGADEPAARVLAFHPGSVRRRRR